MPTTLVDWTRLYRACGLRRTEEYPGRILINLQIRKKITFEIYLAGRIARRLSVVENGPWVTVLFCDHERCCCHVYSVQGQEQSFRDFTAA